MTRKPFAYLFAALLFLLAIVLPSGVQPVKADRPMGLQLSSNSERDSKPGQGSRQQPGSVTTEKWTNLFPELKAVSAVSSTEAWAAGEQGHLAHYVDGHWVAIDTPAWDRLLLSDIKMLSANSGFLASYSLYTPYNYVFQYDGSAWNDRSNGLGFGLSVERLAPISTTNVWATGYGLRSNGWRYSIVHWNGLAWTVQDPVLGVNVVLRGISLASSSDGWAVGTDQGPPGGAGVLLHYDGNSWSDISGNLPSGVTHLDSVWSYAPGDAWIAGGTGAETKVYHYQAGQLADVYTLQDLSPVSSIFMLGPTQGWVAGLQGLYQFDGSAWTPAYTGRELAAISGVQGQVWAVGPGETVLSKTGGGNWTLQRGGPTTDWVQAISPLAPGNAWFTTYHDVLHYTDGSWQVFPLAPTMVLHDLQMSSDSKGFAVGENVIAGWDGLQWSQLVTPGVTLNSLYMTGSDSGWAVGQGGAIWKADNGIWRVATSPTTGELYTVAMDSPSHGWAGGFSYVGGSYYPVLLEFNGTGWVDRTASIPDSTEAIWDIALAPGGTEGWAVRTCNGRNGDWHNFLHLRNGVWSPEGFDFPTYRLAVAVDALGEAWSVGCTGAFHYVNGAWVGEGRAFPTSRCQYHVAILPGREGWSTGGPGEIIKYTPLAPGQRFYDVPLTDTFYTYIEYIASHNYVSGYSDNTFRPYNNTTRTQLTKIVVLAEGWATYVPPTPTFRDVPADHPFYRYIETAYSHGIISGYTCGTNCLEFRPGNTVTRGQLCKIIVLAEGWPIYTPSAPTFVDLPAGNPFYGYIETAYSRNIISGYNCGAGCLEFRPGNNATRGQICKIVYLAVSTP